MKSVYVVYAIVAFMLLTMIGITGVILTDRAKVLVSSQTYDASIQACESRRTIRHSNISRRVRWDYAPIAVSEQGYRVTGQFYITRKSRCESMIGKPVKILVDTNNPDNARINSFLQFWFYPFLIFGAIGLVILGLLQRSGAFVALMFGGIIMAIGGAYHEVNGYSRAKNPAAPIVINNQSVFDVCLEESLMAEEVNRKCELTAFTCVKRSFSDITPLSALTNLEHVNIERNGITTLKPLQYLPRLKTLKVSGNRGLRSFEGIEGLKMLEKLYARALSLDDLNPLTDLTALTYLDVNYSGVSDISPLAKLSKLETLLLGDNPNLTDISALSNKPALKGVSMWGTNVTDVTSLYENKKLRIINIGGEAVPCRQIIELSRRFPGTTVRQTKARKTGPKACQ